jgi:hypothetical protein
MIKIHGNTNFKKFQFFSKKILKIFLCSLWINFTVKSQEMTRAVTSRDNLGGGGGEYSYTRVLPDVFLLKAIVFTVCEHDYMNIHPPPIIASTVVTALEMTIPDFQNSLFSRGAPPDLPRICGS